MTHLDVHTIGDVPEKPVEKTSSGRRPGDVASPYGLRYRPLKAALVPAKSLPYSEINPKTR